MRKFALGMIALWLVPSLCLAVPFAQLSSTETQPSSTTPKVVTLNSTDAAKSFKNENGAITFQEAGVYFGIAAAQVGATGTGGGSVKLWMRLNGKDIDNSNTEQTVSKGFTAVLVCQGVMEVKAGDKLELLHSASADGKGLGLVYSKPEGEPAVPSMIFSAFKCDTGPFAQLSSTDTQASSKTPRVVTLNSLDAAKAIENAGGVITIKEGGAYFAMAAAQSGVRGPGGASVKLWMRQNGKDIDNSNTEQSLASGFTAVQVCQGVMEAKGGDKLELLHSASADGKGVGLVASKPSGEPAIPSMIFSGFKISGGSYAQLSSTETQAATKAAKVLTLNSTDAAKGLENANGVLTIKEAGTYFVIAAGQVGTTGAGGGSVKLWMRQNGKDVDNSNTEQSVEAGYTGVLVCQGVMEMKAGDKLQLVQSASADGKGLGMLATKPTGEPVIPSMIFSAFKVD